jgi:hypothetical protein
MLIETILITELVFYRRQYAMGQNVLVSFRVYISVQAKSISLKTTHTLMPPPPSLTVGTTHAGRYRSPGIRHTQTLLLDRNIVKRDLSLQITCFQLSTVH